MAPTLIWQSTMAQAEGYMDEVWSSLRVVPTVYPTSPPIEQEIGRFWDVGPEFESVEVRIEPPEKPLAILELLGPSPFERSGFPLVGFLATTYDKVSRYALERGALLRRPKESP